MIEMLGVLAIIGVLSAGGIIGYSAAMENYRVNKFAQDMSTFATNAINIFGTARVLGSIIYAHDLCSAKVISSEYCKDLIPGSNYVKSLWGGQNMGIRLTTDNKKYVLVVWNGLQPVFKGGMPPQACVKLATMKWTGFSQVSMFFYHSPSLNGGMILPTSLTTAKQWCYSTGTDSQVDFHFYF